MYLGYVKTTTAGTRKNDDRVEYFSKYGYALNPKLNLSGLFDIKTQFFKGYTYPDATTKIYSSNFFAPAYIILSPGFDYRPVKNLSIFVSPITARWIVVTDTSLSTDYGVPEGKKVEFPVWSVCFNKLHGKSLVRLLPNRVNLIFFQTISISLQM
jgi:hypothetical protein